MRWDDKRNLSSAVQRCFFPQNVPRSVDSISHASVSNPRAICSASAQEDNSATDTMQVLKRESFLLDHFAFAPACLPRTTLMSSPPWFCLPSHGEHWHGHTHRACWPNSGCCPRTQCPPAARHHPSGTRGVRQSHPAETKQQFRIRCVYLNILYAVVGFRNFKDQFPS